MNKCKRSVPGTQQLAASSCSASLRRCPLAHLGMGPWQARSCTRLLRLVWADQQRDCKETRGQCGQGKGLAPTDRVISPGLPRTLL